MTLLPGNPEEELTLEDYYSVLLPENSGKELPLEDYYSMLRKNLKLVDALVGHRIGYRNVIVIVYHTSEANNYCDYQFLLEYIDDHKNMESECTGFCVTFAKLQQKMKKKIGGDGI